MRWVFVLAWLSSGCDVIFRIDRLADATPPLACAVEDDFGGTMIDRQWNQFVNIPQLRLYQDEQLVIDFSNAANVVPGGEAGVRLGGTWNMRGGAVEIEVPQVVGGTTMFVENYLRIRVGSDDGNGYVIRYSAGGIGFWQRVGNVYERAKDRLYDASHDRFWRIANLESDRVTFATRASKNDAWDIDADVSLVAPLDGVQILLVAGTYNSGDPTPGMAIYDNFALCGATQL